jgi:hypothetical protein
MSGRIKPAAGRRAGLVTPPDAAMDLPAAA